MTIEEAQAELTTVVQRAVTERPDTQPRLRPVVAPYTRAHVDLTHPTLVWMLRVAQLVVGVLSFVVAVNLAILMYARMVTRLGEIAVRTALGASRRRILMQLFIEAFALTAAGAATGLMLADVALGRMQSMARMNGGVPFWIHFELSIGTVAFAAALAAGAAVIMGVLPGLKATGQRLTVNLYEMNGRTGTRLGPIWTTLVVAQVGVAVAILPMAVYMAWQVVQLEIAGAGFAAERFVVATAALGDGASPTDAGGVRRRQLELMSRVAAEPGVSAVTFSSSVPGFSGSRHIRFEGGVEVQDESALDVSTFDVALDLFDVYDAELLAGRVFTSADLGPAGAVIVNETFAQRFLGSRSPLGVRFGYPGPLPQQPGGGVGQKSYQIVGVVRDFPRFPPAMSVDREPVVYHPAAPGDVHPFVVSARFAGAIPAGFIDRFRQIGAEVDPALQLRRVVPLTEFYDQLRAFWRYIAWGIGLVTTSVLLLSAAGIYALTSFTVAQRTREIGIRVALGAHPRRLLAAIFARVLCQFALGLLAGTLVSAAVFSSLGLALEQAAGLLLAVAAIMLTVGVVSALAPARRSLRVEATDALRAEI